MALTSMLRVQNTIASSALESTQEFIHSDCCKCHYNVVKTHN